MNDEELKKSIIGEFEKTRNEMTKERALEIVLKALDDSIAQAKSSDGVPIPLILAGGGSAMW